MLKITDLNGNTHMVWPHQVGLTVQGGKCFVCFGTERWPVSTGDMIALSHDLAYAGYSDEEVFEEDGCGAGCTCTPVDRSLFETRIDKYSPEQIGMMVDSLVLALQTVTDKSRQDILKNIGDYIMAECLREEAIV